MSEAPPQHHKPHRLANSPFWYIMQSFMTLPGSNQTPKESNKARMPNMVNLADPEVVPEQFHKHSELVGDENKPIIP